MKKVLVISYYWPPSGGAGVQRWLKFVKYLGEFGWEPVVYTPENPEAPARDESLLKDIPKGLQVLKQPAWEPYDLYKRFVGMKKGDAINAGFLSESKKPKRTEQWAIWLRGNFFIPDARCFWISPSVKYLKAFLQSNPVDAIVSTGPPHSMHLIARKLQQQFQLPWLADFRDPWTQIDFYNQLKLSRLADLKHHRLEKQCLKHANRVVVVSPGMAQAFNTILPRPYEVITNGYDEASIPAVAPAIDSEFSIAHIGSLNKDRNPKLLWRVLAQLTQQHPDFKKALKIKLIGKTDFHVKADLQANGLAENLIEIAYLPHNEVVLEQQKSQINLLLINQTPNANMILTGKLFEYLAAQRPILCIGPTAGDAAQILKESGAGITFDFGNEQGMQSGLMKLFEEFQQDTIPFQGKGTEAYGRRALTKKLAKTLDQMVD